MLASLDPGATAGGHPMTADNRCLNCGAQRPASAPAGLCPQCLLRLGLGADLSNGRGDAGTTSRTAGGPPASVLEVLTAMAGPLPRVTLHDTEAADRPDPLERPYSPEMPDPADRPPRLQLFGEIARGGMGAVLRGRDPDLGREVAVKVLLEGHRNKPDLVRRFVEEAQIGGQLQHPGVVPVYELGTFGDTRPYFAMKLVKGRTFAALLAEREGLVDGLPRLLAIFLQVSQTVAYAHARGVIHRDLKPSNVMVGGFGEVQVMDWGLAKVLRRGGTADDETAGKRSDHETVIATARSGSGADRSLAGSVMGTPAYMAPEQARGEIDRLDERCDVFSLGSMLCEVLTGAPAFTGRTSADIQRQAARGDLTDTWARLDACGADPELLGLARGCLADEPRQRQRDAGEVALAIGRHLDGVQERLRRAELERAAEVARAAEARRTAAAAEARAAAERRARWLTVALAASVLALAAGGGLGTAAVLRQRQAHAATVARALGEVVALRDRALRQPDDSVRWREALATIRRAESDLRSDADPDARRRLAALRHEVQAGEAASERDRELLDCLVDIRSTWSNESDRSDTDAAYAEAFRAAELDIGALSPGEAGARLGARTPSVRLALAEALDDWAALRRWKEDEAGARRLSDLAGSADPDPWRINLRTSLAQPDRSARLAALQALARSADPDRLAATSLRLLGAELARSGDPLGSVAVLRAAQQRHPGDLYTNLNLGEVLAAGARREDAIRYYTAARAIRPESAHALAHALEERGDSDDAIAVFRDLARLRPNHAMHLGCLGKVLRDRGRTREADDAVAAAAALLREEARIKPDNAEVHERLGFVLMNRGCLDEAVAEFRRAVQIRPGFGVAFLNLGAALLKQSKPREAAVACREALRASPNDHKAHQNLGNALKRLGQPDEAAAELREAVRLGRDDAQTHYNLAVLLWEREKTDEAEATFREAIRVNPGYGPAYNYLGQALEKRGDLDRAEAAYRRAIQLNPADPLVLNNLGTVLNQMGRIDDAKSAYRTAIRVKPDLDLAHINLGILLLEARADQEALAELRRAAEVAAPNSPVARGAPRLIRLAEEAVARPQRLEAVLRGDDRPRDAADWQGFAYLCQMRGLYVSAVRLWSSAMEADPKLAADPRAVVRYNAACSAAQAGCGQGQDADKLDGEERVHLRRQALDWLRADVDAWRRLLDKGPEKVRPIIVERMRHSLADADFSRVRGPALGRLAEAERLEWDELWSDVAKTLARVQARTTPVKKSD
jgi:serine/threonine-protein kinase